MSANDDGTFSERSENKGPVLFYFIFSLCFLSRFVFMKSSDREESCSSPETLRNLSLQILKPSEKKAKYQYGGLNSGRPITPPRNNLVKAKWSDCAWFESIVMRGSVSSLSSCPCHWPSKQDNDVAHNARTRRFRRSSCLHCRFAILSKPSIRNCTQPCRNFLWEPLVVLYGCEGR